MISIDNPTNDGDQDEKKNNNIDDVGTSSHPLQDITNNEEGDKLSVNIDAVEQELPSEQDRIQVVSESPSTSAEEIADGMKQSSKQKPLASFESDSLLTVQKGTAVKAEKRAGSRRCRKIFCCRTKKSTDSINEIEMEAQPLSLENDTTRLSESSPASKEETNKTEKQSCCDCSVFKRKMSTTIDCIKNFLLAISIIGLAKSLFSFGVFLYDVISDIIVGKEQIDKGETWWGLWIVMLMFVPNLVFIVWFIIANRNKLSIGGTWLKITIAGSVQLVTLINLVLGILVSFKKDGKLRLGGEILDADSIMGNANFFKTVEGFMESLPQSTYQLSIMMRTPWHDISLNQKLSVAMSLFTLSNTAATYLLYQHHQYFSFDKRMKKRYRGFNNPSLLYTLFCTIFYVMLTAPRIWANALIIAITPKLALIMIVIEFLINLLISHKFAMGLNENQSFPSGILTAIINFCCPCTHFSNVGKINFFSSLVIVFKVILVYPIVFFNVLTVQNDNNPDQFRCWASNDTMQHLTVQESNQNKTSFRICNDENPNQFLFEIILPLTISCLLLLSIPFGFLISRLVTRPLLTSLDQKVSFVLNAMKTFFSNCVKRVKCCCDDKEDDEDKEYDEHKGDSEMIDATVSQTTQNDPADVELGLNPSSNDMPIDGLQNISEEIEDEFDNKESQVSKSNTWKNNVMLFLLNIRTIFDELQHQEDGDCTRILIAGGSIGPSILSKDDPEKLIDTSYILEVNFDVNIITNIHYKELPNVPHSFRYPTFGRFRGRSLIMGGLDSNGQCLEFDQEEYQVIPSLNVNRYWGAASTFIQNKVVVAGGYDNTYNNLDSIEILDWDESNHGSQWIHSPSRLPIKVYGHTLVTFNNKLYLFGGHDGSDDLDTIWEGTFDKPSNKISWVEMGLRLQKKRYWHFSFVISNQIITFGGRGVKNDFVEIIENNKLRQGPKVPFKLNTNNAQALLDRKNRFIITSKENGLIVYDHEVGTFTNYDNFKLREERKFYAAILQ